MVLRTMGFFATRKKKSDNIKTLSEAEIQQRLYGHLRIPGAAVEDSAFTRRRPAAESSKDLFRKSQASAETSKAQESLAAQKTISTGIPAEPARPKAGRSDSVPAADLSPKPKPKIRKNPLAPIPGILLVFLKSVLFVSLTTLFKLAGSVLRFFISIDFRKPQIQKIASTLGAAAFVALLFLGTHFLNVRREAAMKSPHHKTFAKPAAKTSETIPPGASNRSAEISVEELAIAAKSKAELHPPAGGISAAADAPVSRPIATLKSSAAQGTYSIQLATFAAREDADRLVTKLRDQDADAFIKELDRPGGGTYYCVFVGHYKDFREGEEGLARFKKKSLAKPFLDAFVRALKTE